MKSFIMIVCVLASLVLPNNTYAVEKGGVCKDIARAGIQTSEEALSCAQEWLDLWDLTKKGNGPQKILANLYFDTERFSGPFGVTHQTLPQILVEMGFYLAQYKSWNLTVIRALPLGKNGFATEYRGTATKWNGEKIKAWGSDWITIDEHGKFLTWSGYYNDEKSVPTN